MARNQFLINYHTSGNVKPVEEVKLGEIVVQHNNEEPKLIIKKTDGTWAEFVDSNEVVKIVSGITNPIELRVTELEGEFEALSAATTAISGTYATKVEAQGYANDAQAAAIASASAYTDTQVNALSGAVNTKFTKVEGDIEALSGATEKAISAITETISKAYVYKGSVENKENLPASGNVGDVYNVVNASGVLGEADYIPAGTNYAWDGEKWDALGGIVDLSNYVTSADLKTVKENIDEIEGNIEALSGATSAISGTYATKVEAQGYADAAKTAAIASASAYTDTQVNALSGDVDTKFDEVEADIKELSAATREISKTYATKGVAEAYASEAKAAAIALASAYTDTQVNTLSGAVDTKFTKVEGDIDALSAATTAISNTYATKDYADGKANEAKAAAIASASAYTDTQVNTLSGAVDTKFADVEGDIEALSGVTGTAVQGVTVSGIEGVSTGKTEGNIVNLDFTKVVIDCGNF